MMVTNKGRDLRRATGLFQFPVFNKGGSFREGDIQE